MMQILNLHHVGNLGSLATELPSGGPGSMDGPVNERRLVTDRTGWHVTPSSRRLKERFAGCTRTRAQDPRCPRCLSGRADKPD